ncbi:MAG TPA: 16S rRNA (guanine(527)-N(7))-methyltransferase RsmG [Candidatus Fimenecus excrementavium]|nr:16S rRNA (guanine(527)-N(7))-methyltransferase RsmG [Candidatus Fimenecus excrementavium]
MLEKALLLDTLAPLGVTLSDEAFARLDAFAEQLVETNRQFNLTAITEPADMTVKHFADSLSLFSFADFPQNAKIIDVGTGAGFPGLVLKLARPDLEVTFLDSTRKKLGFIESVLQNAGLSGEILHRRAEEAGQDKAFREQFDFATARAVSDLRNLAEYCLPFVKAGGYFLSMKSAGADEEIAAAKNALHLLGGKIERDEVFSLTPEMPRRLLFIKKISQTPPKYPRPSAKIAKNPLK